MLRKLFTALFVLVAPTAMASAQTTVRPCWYNSSGQCVNVGTSNPMPTSLSAGALILGKVGIDQTTPGTTNGVTLVPSSATAAGVTPVVTSALAANLVVKASAGNLYSFQVSADSTLSAAAWWLMIYDATSAPGDGGVTPKKCYAMAAGTTFASFSFPVPILFATGITMGVSTNGCFTKAASTHAFMSGDAQ